MYSCVSMEIAIEEEASGYHREAFAMVPTEDDYNVELKCRITFIHLKRRHGVMTTTKLRQ